MVKKDRRIYYNDEDYEVLKKLKLKKPFKKLNLIDLFALSLVYGKMEGIKTPLNSKRIGRIRNETVLKSDVNYLMMALAVDDADSLDVLASEDAYFTICEEYAKTGLYSLESHYSNNPKEFLRELELEALKYYDEYIEKE